jgi:hypothetical protein
MERNLTIATRLFLAGVAGYFLLSMLLARAGFQMEWALVPLWLFNLVVAFYIAKAAKAQEKNSLLYGLVAAAIPVGTFVTWLKLRRDAWYAQLDRGDS